MNTSTAVLIGFGLVIVGGVAVFALHKPAPIVQAPPPPPPKRHGDIGQDIGDVIGGVGDLFGSIFGFGL